MSCPANSRQTNAYERNRRLGERRNGKQAKIDWQFKTDDARIKLKHLYPKIKVDLTLAVRHADFSVLNWFASRVPSELADTGIGMAEKQSGQAGERMSKQNKITGRLMVMSRVLGARRLVDKNSIESCSCGRGQLRAPYYIGCIGRVPWTHASRLWFRETSGT
jgi:hypothetical protein